MKFKVQGSTFKVYDVRTANPELGTLNLELGTGIVWCPGRDSNPHTIAGART
jgi:hypothetical protein